MDDNKKLAALHELSRFGGSERYYKHPLYKLMVYTEGVQYLRVTASPIKSACE